MHNAFPFCGDKEQLKRNCNHGCLAAVFILLIMSHHDHPFFAEWILGTPQWADKAPVLQPNSQFTCPTL